MFDRSIRTTMEEKGGDFIFSCIDGILQGADLVVANLEGPITSHESVSVGTLPGGKGNYTFTFPTSTAKLLFAHNIRLVNIGNNHIMNFGREGLAQTKQLLGEAGVGYFGDPFDAIVAHRDIQGVRLAFISYNEFAPGGWKESASTTLREIHAALSEKYAPIVYTHWGDEYVSPPSRVKQLARSFVEAGAEIVIGSHPHVVQEHELYASTTLTTSSSTTPSFEGSSGLSEPIEGTTSSSTPFDTVQGKTLTASKHIYYSLGNFIFDQYWDETVRRGLLLRVELTPTGVVSVEEIPIDNQTDRRTCAA